MITGYVIFTVMIGSKGPKISSFMIAESSGTSSNNVGAIFLRHNKKWYKKLAASHACDSEIIRQMSKIHSQLLFVTLATEDDLVVDHVIIHERLQSIEMVGVHDARQIRWPQRVLPVELLQDFAQGTQLPIRTRTESVPWIPSLRVGCARSVFYQLRRKRLCGYDVIRCDASLAIVATPLSGSNPLSSNLQQHYKFTRFYLQIYSVRNQAGSNLKIYTIKNSFSFQEIIRSSEEMRCLHGGQRWNRQPQGIFHRAPRPPASDASPQRTWRCALPCCYLQMLYSKQETLSHGRSSLNPSFVDYCSRPDLCRRSCPTSVPAARWSLRRHPRRPWCTSCPRTVAAARLAATRWPAQSPTASAKRCCRRRSHRWSGRLPALREKKSTIK